ncbi:MAG TPA: T9SS type A sorting domain-containing protein, partial [Bacteroidia bacterium]
LDDQGKIITRITHEMTFIDNNNKPTQIKINGTDAVNVNEKYLYSCVNKPQDFNLQVSSTGVTFKFGKYNSVNASIYDNTSNWNKPKSIRFSFSGGDYDKAMGLQDLKFTVISSQKPSITVTGNVKFCQGDSVKLTSSTGNSYNWSTGSKTQSITVKSSGVYSVTVADANGCQATTPTVTVTVNPNPTPIITQGAALNLCQGDTVKLSTSTTGTYLWSNGKTTSNIAVTAAGSYNVKVTDANGCKGTSSNTVVTVKTLPTVTVSASGPLSFCQGKSVQLTASGTGSYLWSNGANTQSITVNNSGNYFVKLTDGFGCKATSSTSTVSVNPYPVPSITANKATVFCEGDSVTLSSSPATVYSWSNGANTQSINVKTGGSYTVNAGDGNGCSATSNPEAVTVNALPTPVISANFNTLTSSLNGKIEWFLDGKLLQGENGQTLVAKTAGVYKVSVTDANTCTGYSAEYTHSMVGIQELQGNNVKVYPNPSSGIFKLETNDFDGKYMVFDQTGKVIASGSTSAGQIDLSNFATGVYFLKIVSGDKVYHAKLTKE